MVGQLKLLTKLTSYSEDSFPHSLLLTGPVGCGKHSVVDFIGNLLNLTPIDATSKVSLEFIQEAYLQPLPYLYFIDINKLTEKQQNVLLKFVEEPSDDIYIVLICTSKSLVLDTIYNRCQHFEFESYSKEELSEFIVDFNNKELILKYCTTPGQVKEATAESILKYEDIANKIVSDLYKARYSNIIKLAEKMAGEDESIDLFYRVLRFSLYEAYINQKKLVLKQMYDICETQHKKLSDSRFAKKNLLQSLISELWHVAREGYLNGTDK